MNQSVKALVQLVLVLCILASIPVWLVDRPGTGVWLWRFGLTTGIIVTGWLWYRSAHFKEKLPDLLGQISRSYFERDGLCFAPVVERIDGVCWISIFFQNRYSGQCTCRVSMLPPQRTLWFGRHNLPEIAAELNCPGGAFGVTRFPYAVPQKYQGKTWQFDVYAATTYPQGKGDMLRFREGMLTGSTASFTISSARGHARFFFPTGLAPTVATRTETTEILWQPDLPTRAFPVIQAVKPAADGEKQFLVDAEE